MSTIKLYHYTTKEGAEGILESGCLKKSEKAVKDAVLGDGVYFTSIAPRSVTKQKIAQNNWDVGTSSAMQLVKDGKLDFYIKIKFKKNDPKLEDVSHLSRDIWLYRDDVVLPKFDYTIEEFNDIDPREFFNTLSEILGSLVNRVITAK
ncbi:uncharacterized protein LOC130649168 [Hydractinia symbiolongicarpus]|uniref:uncharacterized protein LOC130649168 n=1 Tax=Hydractinia symbiolongicarpus TaxID=13093 RepID=UPI00254A4271|nr:uncharacterized protein LOC130649168 [Hydractinia symbiolongicarpus]